jgi:hypothetical protein
MKGLRRWSDWYLRTGGKVLRDDEEDPIDKGKRIIVVTEGNVIMP